MEVSAGAGVLAMVTGSGPVVQMVLILLLVLSVWSWALVIGKGLQLKRANQSSDEFNQLFWEVRNFARLDETAKRLSDSPLASMFGAGYREILKLVEETKNSGKKVFESDNVERALKQARFVESRTLEKGLTFLATVASAAPFIGLFGTVWGIMNAFHGLSTAKSTTIQAVAPGISEALVATAVGLAAAIPAAVAYNYFSVAVKDLKSYMDRFSLDFLDVARKNF